MIYLVILVLAASVSIGRLWILQRRGRSHLQTVDGFRTSLQRLSEPAQPASEPMRARARPRSLGGSASRRRVPPPQRDRPTELDPARRAAAKKRIKARRATRRRAAS